jgi:hypothetical protein
VEPLDRFGVRPGDWVEIVAPEGTCTVVRLAGEVSWKVVTAP